ncbi:queuosine precursor transporter [Candidatus Dependentiae bacterium]|nr:queuosine precursor transporter [Candidatus Dependentiae bacterium]
MICNELIIVLHSILITTTVWLAFHYGKSALIALISLLIVLANVLILKEIAVVGLCITATDALSIGAGIGLSLLQYRWGREVALQGIIISFGCAVAAGCLTQLHIWYLPTLQDTAHAPYAAIFSMVPQIIAASLLSYVCCQLIELRILALLRTHATALPFELQGWIAVCVSATVDTVLFSLLALYGIVSNIMHIIVVSLIVKLITAAIGYCLIAMLRKLSPAS